MPDISNTTWVIGEWMQSGKLPGPAPHEWPAIPHKPLQVVWADKGHEVPIAVQDWDGCQAIIQGQADG
jgi:hypothetical protein